MQAKIHLAMVLIILIITGPDGQTVYAERHVAQINLDRSWLPCHQVTTPEHLTTKYDLHPGIFISSEMDSIPGSICPGSNITQLMVTLINQPVDLSDPNRNLIDLDRDDRVSRVAVCQRHLIATRGQDTGHNQDQRHSVNQ